MLHADHPMKKKYILPVSSPPSFEHLLLLKTWATEPCTHKKTYFTLDYRQHWRWMRSSDSDAGLKCECFSRILLQGKDHGRPEEDSTTQSLLQHMTMNFWLKKNNTEHPLQHILNNITVKNKLDSKTSHQKKRSSNRFKFNPENKLQV